jgi:hypothetical protein
VTIFDPTDPEHGAYCAQLAEHPTDDSDHKLVLTDEAWNPNWTLPGDPRPRVLVTLRPAHVTGRGHDPDTGWRIRIEGADDTAMVLELTGPGQDRVARTIYDHVGDHITRSQLEQLAFTQD